MDERRDLAWVICNAFGKRHVSSLRDSDRFRIDPGLTSWANIFRPFGAVFMNTPSRHIRK
jgi:hypothetical protein